MLFTAHLEQSWHTKKVKLHQRLGLRLFQQDVKQVCLYLKLTKYPSQCQMCGENKLISNGMMMMSALY
jgi:hypothetical protein